MGMEPDGPDANNAGAVSARERDLLRALLRRYNDQPDERAAITAEIERRFRRPLAMLAIDSSGFSRSVRSGGIVHFLALLERLGGIVRPLVEAHEGRVLHTEADNIFAAFPTPTAATRCAVAILHTLERANAPLPEADQLYVAMGIGYGEVLVTDNDTLYGDEMNLACKLGEDLAGRGEVLLTPGAHRELAPGDWRFEEQFFSISGLDLPAFRLVL